MSAQHTNYVLTPNKLDTHLQVTDHASLPTIAAAYLF